MKIAMKLIAACVLTVLMVELVTGVPVKSKEDVKDVKADPCHIEEFKNVTICDEKDDKCKESRKKRQTLCESNPNCDFCGTLIEGDHENDINVNVADVIEASFEEEAEAPKRLVERNIIIENDNDTQYYRGYVESAANITTVIRLVNHINNTNIVNMPTTLNNTNVNNIHIFQNTSSNEGGKFGLGFDDTGSCCYAAKPKTCKQTTSGPKCHYRKQKVCGRQCTKKMIFPNQNRCSYSPQWPYVRCPNQQQGYQQQFGYNQQFGYGNQQQFGGNGYYQQPQPYFPQYYPQSPPQYIPLPPDMELQDIDDEAVFPDDEELENPESGWTMEVEKCKIVSENGMTITNCTGNGREFEHPFARNSDGEESKRNTRQAGAPMMFPPQIPMMYPAPQMMYPPMYQPMPMIYYPQQYQSPYFAPPPPAFNPYQSHQIPMPPIEEFDSEETEEVHPIRKHRRHAKKHNPVVMEVDGEL